MMVIPNDFLLNGMTINGEHVDNCFCQVCRGRKLQRLLNAGLTNLQLYDRCFIELVEQEDERLRRLFHTTVRRIIAGKAYREQCLAGTNYTSFGWWARQANQFRHMPAKERMVLVKKVNEINLVFSNWEVIVRNLTDSRMLYVDARRFSVNQFYRAVDIGWCLRQNELHRPAGRNDGDPVYPEDMYQGILQYVYNSGILDHVDHDSAIGSVIGG